MKEVWEWVWLLGLQRWGTSTRPPLLSHASWLLLGFGPLPASLCGFSLLASAGQLMQIAPEWLLCITWLFLGPVTVAIEIQTWPGPCPSDIVFVWGGGKQEGRGSAQWKNYRGCFQLDIRKYFQCCWRPFWVASGDARFPPLDVFMEVGQ